jgi:hypothetical protein
MPPRGGLFKSPLRHHTKPLKSLGSRARGFVVLRRLSSPCHQNQIWLTGRRAGADRRIALKLLLQSHGVPPSNDDLPKLASVAKPFFEAHVRALGLDGESALRVSQGLITVVNEIAPIRNSDSPTPPDVVAKTSTLGAAELC